MTVAEVISGFSLTNRMLLYTSVLLAPAQFVSGIKNNCPSNLGFLAYNWYTQLQWYQAVDQKRLHALSLVLPHFNLMYSISYLGGISSGNVVMGGFLGFGTAGVLLLNTVCAWTSWATNQPEGFGVYHFFFFGWRTLNPSWHKFLLVWEIFDTLLAGTLAIVAILKSFEVSLQDKNTDDDDDGAGAKCAGWAQTLIAIPVGSAVMLIAAWPLILWVELIVAKNHMESATDWVAVLFGDAANWRVHLMNEPPKMTVTNLEGKSHCVFQLEFHPLTYPPEPQKAQQGTESVGVSPIRSLSFRQSVHYPSNSNLQLSANESGGGSGPAANPSGSTSSTITEAISRLESLLEEAGQVSQLLGVPTERTSHIQSGNPSSIHRTRKPSDRIVSKGKMYLQSANTKRQPDDRSEEATSAQPSREAPYDLPDHTVPSHSSDLHLHDETVRTEAAATSTMISAIEPAFDRSSLSSSKAARTRHRSFDNLEAVERTIVDSAQSASRLPNPKQNIKDRARSDTEMPVVEPKPTMLSLGMPPALKINIGCLNNQGSNKAQRESFELGEECKPYSGHFVQVSGVTCRDASIDMAHERNPRGTTIYLRRKTHVDIFNTPDRFDVHESCRHKPVAKNWPDSRKRFTAIVPTPTTTRTYTSTAKMDIVDRDMERAEYQATRIWSQSSKEHHEEEIVRRASGQEHRDDESFSSSSTNSDRGNMNRIATASAATIGSRGYRTQTHPIEDFRTETHRLQQVATVGASSLRKRKTLPLPEFGGGKPYPPQLPEQEQYVVEFDGKDDPLHPQNWPLRSKLIISAVLAYTCFSATFTSSIFSASTISLASYFDISIEVATLSTSLFVLGFAFGPLIWGPFSELQGRKLPIIVGMFGFSIFCFAAATAKDIQTLMICRFFNGIFGSCPLAVVAAVFADIFNNAQRGIAIVIFSAMVFMGPMFGPFIGGFINHSYLHWRWNLYLPGIMSSSALILVIFFVRESYAPIVLVSKAAELRRRTKNWGIHAKQEEIEVDLTELVTKNFSRPIRLLISEPIILLVTIYMSFIYALLYVFLTAYPLVFQGVHGMEPGVSGLPFFGMVVGIFLVALYIIWSNRAYTKKLEANGGIPVPEWRLPPVILGGVLFATGLFWFGWSGYRKSIPWIAPTLSGLFTGFGLLAIFIQLFNYIIDSYLMFSASAIAANTFLRSILAAGFPLFSRQLFNNLGIEWASTLLGGIALLCVPIPVCFYLFGKKIRQKSKFVPIMIPHPEDGEDFANGEDDNAHDMSALHATRSHVHHDLPFKGRTQTRTSGATGAHGPIGGIDLERALQSDPQSNAVDTEKQV
ncbi:hypothetical protein DV736_g2627, partial [Chaetothyriales sp. CBS 134916]